MSVADIVVETSESANWTKYISALLTRNYSELNARIRSLDAEVRCPDSQITLRLYYPAFRNNAPTIGDLIDAIASYIIPFALPRSQIEAVYKLYGDTDVAEFSRRHSELEQQALALFKRVQESTQRNGEAGELLLYVLTEWILGAPQLLAKMCLKTNRNMPVHGSDGIHVRYFKEKNTLCFYYGEAKLHSAVGKAISAAIVSITSALKHESIKHEIELVHRHIDLTGLDQSARNAILQYLDPFDEKSNRRVDIATCLVGFDFNAFKAALAKGADVEDHFRQMAKQQLEDLGPGIGQSLRDITSQVEFFFFPVPSVDELRDMFQSKVGWQKPKKPPEKT